MTTVTNTNNTAATNSTATANSTGLNADFKALRHCHSSCQMTVSFRRSPRI